MSADIHTLPARNRRSNDSGRVYHCVLVRDDVTISELCHALRFSGIVLTTDAATGQQIIHKHTPPDAA